MSGDLPTGGVIRYEDHLAALQRVTEERDHYINNAADLQLMLAAAEARAQAAEEALIEGEAEEQLATLRASLQAEVERLRKESNWLYRNGHGVASWKKSARLHKHLADRLETLLKEGERRVAA